MKKNIIVIAFMLFVSSVFSQKINEAKVPQAVKSSFAKSFPNSKIESWEFEDSLYEAEFEQNEKDCSATFDSSGKLLETEVEFEYKDLPNDVKVYIEKNHKVKQIKEVEKITNEHQVITYEVELADIDLIFDANGTFIKEAKK
jgi:hypothetical protein